MIPEGHKEAVDLLVRLESEGHARLDEDGESVVGIAADGVEVHLGDIRDGFAGLVSYILSHPSPEDW